MDGSSPVEAPGRMVEMEVELKPRNTDEPHDADAPPEAERAAHRSAKRDALPVEELCAEQPLETRIEALLLTSDRPITEFRLAEILGLTGKGAHKRVNAAIESLNSIYLESQRSFRAERLAGGWQILTVPAFGPLLHRLHEKRQETRLSQPAMETLSIIAYRQPIMRAEIEAIRGVASGEVLRSLLERRMVKIVGRAEELGRPMLYGTTSEFLKVFGMASMDDLPAIKGLMPAAPKRPRIASAETAPNAAEAPPAENAQASTDATASD